MFGLEVYKLHLEARLLYDADSADNVLVRHLIVTTQQHPPFFVDFCEIMQFGQQC